MLQHPWVTIRRTLTRVYLFWCSDLLDQHAWAERPPWWQQGGLAAVQRLVLSLAALLPVCCALIGLFAGRLHRVRYAWLWAGIVVLVPAPYYLTHVVALYPLAFKPYLLLWVLEAWLGSREDPSVPESTGSKG